MNPQSERPDRDLDRLLAVPAAQHRTARAPLSVERAVLAEFDAARRHRVGKRLALAGAIAASLLVHEWPVSRPAAVAAVASPASAPAVVVAAEPAQAFLAIPYTVPLAPGERATVVRMVLSASAMAAIGFPLPAIDPGNEAQADVLVGEDGRARAVRIVANGSE